MLCFFILAESGVCRLIYFFSIFSCYLFRSVFSAANEKQFTFEHRHILYWCVLFAAARSTSTPDNISEKHFDSEIHSNTIWYLCSNSLRIWQAKSEKKRKKKYRFICNICNAFAATRRRRLMVERLPWQKPFVVATFLRDCSSKLIFVNTIRKIVSFAYTFSSAVFVFSLCERKRERVRAPFSRFKYIYFVFFLLFVNRSYSVKEIKKTRKRDYESQHCFGSQSNWIVIF